MLRNVTQLTVQVGEKLYHLFCDHDSPIGHVKEAIFEFTKVVAEVEQKIKDAQKPAEEEQKVDEPMVQAQEV